MARRGLRMQWMRPEITWVDPGREWAGMGGTT